MHRGIVDDAVQHQGYVERLGADRGRTMPFIISYCLAHLSCGERLLYHVVVLEDQPALTQRRVILTEAVERRRLVTKRAGGTPLQHILGEVEVIAILVRDEGEHLAGYPQENDAVFLVPAHQL